MNNKSLFGLLQRKVDLKSDPDPVDLPLFDTAKPQCPTVEWAGSQCGGTEGSASDGQGRLAAIAGYPGWNCPNLQNIAQENGHAHALLAAYSEYGKNLARYISSSFSFLVIDSDASVVIAGVDRMGSQPLYYGHSNDTVWFGSTPPVFDKHKEHQSALILNSQGLYNYVYFHMLPSPGTILSGIKKLPAAHTLAVTSDGLIAERYWEPEFCEKTNKSEMELQSELKTLLKRAVKKASTGGAPVAAFLSGGLDSSTVVGTLAELNSGSTEAYSIGFDAEGYDEMAYARLTANHFGAKLHEYYVTPEDVVSALPEIAASYPEPFGNSSALPAWFCAREAARNGVKRLLAGDGGDEIFAGNERYALHRVFKPYIQLPRWLKAALIEPLIKSCPAGLPLANKAKSYIAQANTPLPERLQTYNFLHRHEPGEVFTNDFLKLVSADEPITMQRSIFTAPQGASDLNRMLYLDWQYTLADNDLRKVSHMCDKAGVEVAYPMIDDELLEFASRIPSSMKLKGADLRHFYKRALGGWLPDATINKAKHGFGLPFGVWMRDYAPLREYADDVLEALRKRAIFNEQFISRSKVLHREEHAAYYGDLIWVMVTLELWLQGNKF